MAVTWSNGSGFSSTDTPPSRESSDRIIVSWDAAQSSKELASYSACVVLKVRGETIYVMDVFRDRLEYPDLRRKVIEIHKRWRNEAHKYELLIENKGAGISLIQDLQQTERIYAIGVDPVGDKVMRMNEQTARIESGAVHLPRWAPWLGEFRREISAFPTSRHSDQVDTFSQALRRIHDRSEGEWSSGWVRGLTS